MLFLTASPVLIPNGNHPQGFARPDMFQQEAQAQLLREQALAQARAQAEAAEAADVALAMAASLREY